MKVVDLAPEHEPLYFVCLKDWSEDMKDAGGHKQLWYNKMKDQGVRVKLALDDNGNVGGMIQYAPIEHSFAQGKDLYFVDCIWVHGHNKGRGNFQKHGFGRALLQAAEEDAKAQGAKGLAAWGLLLPFWMKASWFRKQGYRSVDRMGIQSLLWKPFTAGAVPPRWTRQKKKPEGIPGQVTVTALLNGWCPAQNMAYERARRAAAEFGDRVVFQAIDTLDRQTFQEWGVSDALFIDGKQVRTGPPPSYEKIRDMIGKKVKKL
ncbi:MAG: GNAT family N-acetyltransferase [Chloroflexi bacterium]|nr:GNAT family N-acetyltransferase [Chloroflexota bacterium]